MKSLIKVVNPVVAEKLATMGFSYMQEKVNSSAVYVFPASEDLLKVLSQNFANSDFMLENKLRF